jgi:hypothetical protein
MRKPPRLLLLTVTMVAASVFAAPLASAAQPAPGFSQFAGCPSQAENPEIEACFTSTIKGGPIEKPITLSGGWGPAEKSYFSPKGGMTKAKEKVPGGLIGLTGMSSLANLVANSPLGLTVTPELAGTPSSPLNPPFQVPLKMHLENPAGLLGPNCYIGSNSSPIMLSLVTEPTNPPAGIKPIAGHNGEFKVSPTNESIILLDNSEFVDNTFSVPTATGCTMTMFGFIPVNLDNMVDKQSGLPAAAGFSEAHEIADGEVAESRYVYP